MMQTLYSLGTRTLKKKLYVGDKQRLFIAVVGEAAVYVLSARPQVCCVISRKHKAEKRSPAALYSQNSRISEDRSREQKEDIREKRNSQTGKK